MEGQLNPTPAKSAPEGSKSNPDNAASASSQTLFQFNNAAMSHCGEGGSIREKGIEGRHAEADSLGLGNQPGTTPFVNASAFSGGKTSYWVSPASTFWWYSSTASFHS
jgi:hypothetical protein